MDGHVVVGIDGSLLDLPLGRTASPRGRPVTVVHTHGSSEETTMSRTLFEAVPMTAEVDLRLRRIENRITGIEAALRTAHRPRRRSRP